MSDNQHILPELSLEEKACRYDELQRWWWWLDRRRKGGWAQTTHLRVFMSEIQQLFEPYKEDKHEH